MFFHIGSYIWLVRGSPAKLLKIDFKYGENERYGLTTEAEYYDFFDSSICDGKVVLERIGPKSVRQREILYFASHFIPLGGAGSPHNKFF